MSRATRFKVFRYFGTTNLGDAIQTIALARLLPGKLVGVDRATGIDADLATRFVVNGWLGNNRMFVASRCLFAGVHLAQAHNLEWFAGSPWPIGARDPWTLRECQGREVPARMIGCATSTFERYSGPRSGIYSVDLARNVSMPRAALRVTHTIAADLPWPDQWALALHVLDLYRRASVVYTSRLHVALPCLAFGTPVLLPSPGPPGSDTARRFGAAQAIGLRFDEVNEFDVSGPAADYRTFLEDSLGIRTISNWRREAP